MREIIFSTLTPGSVALQKQVTRPPGQNPFECRTQTPVGAMPLCPAGLAQIWIWERQKPLKELKAKRDFLCSFRPEWNLSSRLVWFAPFCMFLLPPFALFSWISICISSTNQHKHICPLLFLVHSFPMSLIWQTLPMGSSSFLLLTHLGGRKRRPLEISTGQHKLIIQ